MPKVTVLQHAPPETLGTIADALDLKGVSVHYVRAFQEDPIPQGMGESDGLIVMGGPMGVYDGSRYPFLEEETRLIQQALKAGKPVLGICLGSQLLAAALGASVTRKPDREIGWHLVRLTDEGMDDPLWTGLEKSFFAYHWHRDVFELPEGAVSLASSEKSPHQAFRHGRNAYGFLFHLEMTENMIREMIRTFSNELEEEKLEGGWLMQKSQEHLGPLERLSHAVFTRWADLLT